jgi:multidrug resistance efflux pump
MLEFMLCSMLTILPDFLYRRFGQGKRLGREITLFSVWYELRWGIVGCVLLTLTLITLIFYFHPATSSAATFFRTIPVLPEGSGRVAEVYVGLREEVTAGTRLFRLDSTEQQAAVETARRRIVETEAALAVARTDLAVADARIGEARSAYLQAMDELETRRELLRRGSGAVSVREVERAQNAVDGRQSAVDAAIAAKSSVVEQVNALLPAQKASAEAALAQAEAELAKTVVYAGVNGRLEQFTLRVGDVVNPFMRPAGILIPARAGRLAIQAGFGQIEAQVIRPGMIGEAVCISVPFEVIPLVVTEVQSVIAAGQIRPTDQLIDAAQVTRPGTVTAYLEPLFEGVFEDLSPGSSCIVNAYTSNYETLQDPSIGAVRRFGLHAIDTLGLVHALLLRMQAILLPVRTLVLSGGH